MNSKATYTFFRREVKRVTSIWKQTVIAPVITNILFLVIFGVALSSRASAFEGYEYLSVLIPGLVAMGLMMNSFMNPMSSLIIAKYTNNIQDILMLPLYGWEICLAYIGAGVVRGIFVGGATLIAGAFFAPVSFSHPLIILLFTALLGGIFAAGGVIIGILSNDFDQANILPTFILTPLIYLGGVFYSVGTLPGVFAKVSKLNPIFYLVDGFRYGFLGIGDAPLWLSIVVALTLFTTFFSIASWMFQNGYKLKS